MFEDDLKRLNTLSFKEIQELFTAYFKCTKPKRSKEFYTYNVAYRMQELEYGGLNASTKALLKKLQIKPQSTRKNTIAPIGTKIIKTYKGKDYVVRILENGFDLDGKRFKSLSGMAKQITGMKVSGKLFFGLSKRG